MFRKIVKTSLIILSILVILYIIFIFTLKYLINNGYTNSDSSIAKIANNEFIFDFKEENIKEISIDNVIENDKSNNLDNKGENIEDIHFSNNTGNKTNQNIEFISETKNEETITNDLIDKVIINDIPDIKRIDLGKAKENSILLKDKRKVIENYKKSYILKEVGKAGVLTKEMYKYLMENFSDIERIFAAYDYLNETDIVGIIKKANNDTNLIEYNKTDIIFKTNDLKKEVETLIKDQIIWFPKNILDNNGFMFIIKGIGKREKIINTIKEESKKLGIEHTLVLSSLLGEQVRIAVKGFRGDLKGIILNSTPTLFLSYNVSLGIGGIKTTTAKQIVSDAIEYGYGDTIKNHLWNSEEQWFSVLTESDYWQGIYPTYLVKNILTRWSNAGFDISNNPGVVGTLYNMGNNIKKKPHGDPQIGGSIITIGNKDYVYGGVSLGIYWYLKIYNPI